ncbi:3'-5' exonuclease domain similar to epsilon subunit of DNA polymerase III, PA3232-type [hydrothermal vent metagenome]|uniref:3'-5' exonuclease domain similar to epsilon subunit of DNA polymerase III, PA3232-type n=1 Tax=hydrothermal vent metagenome TaxID=652676 RepID=A0A1W1C4C8_9ZZZZ
MFERLKRNYNKKRLTDDRFAFLFDDTPSDEIVVYDCETTGLDTKRDEIISIGAVKIRGDKILLGEALHIYIKPMEDISHKSIAIHQIRNCDVADGVSATEAIESFLYYIGNRDLVGYYLEFDVAMVNRYTKEMIGINLPNKMQEVSALYYDKKINTIPQGNIDLSFDTILQDLALPKLKAHDALNDAVMTAMMYLKIKNSKKLN